MAQKNKGIIFKPNHKKDLECYVNADFAAGWQNVDADNPENILLIANFYGQVNFKQKLHCL